MTRRRGPEVIVVGAGMVGSALALALAQAGRQVCLVEHRVPERWQAEPADLRVVALAPDNAAWLQALGVWAVIAAQAQPYRAMRVWDAGAPGEVHFSADEMGRAELGWIIENRLIVDVLWQAVTAHPGVRCCCPDEVDAIEPGHADVSVGLRSGVRWSADLLVAADGGASPTRARLGIGTQDRDYGQRALVALVNTESPHQSTCWQRFLPGGPLAFLPFRDGRSSIVWSLPAAEADRLRGLDEAAFSAELERALDGRLGALQVASPRLAFPLRRSLALDYVRGRCALVGDAAHVVHPLAGQGVNLGLRDARALALATAGADDCGELRALQRWARRQRSDNAVAAHAFETILRVTTSSAMLPTLARGPLLGLVDRFQPIKQMLMRQAMGG
ncbi:MAG: FAD-dependent monooxygenase [Xanthomonadales bacterium]|nr:FAD-dependent monooxygenase [Xanthomonadales bacterium]